MAAARLCFLPLVLAALGPLALAAEPVDRYGDPLPPAAVARFGTVRFRHHGIHLRKMAFSPDGTLLATAGDGAHVFLWDSTTGKEVLRVRTSERLTQDVIFAPDGKAFAVAGSGGVQIFETATGKAGRFLPDEGWISRIAWTGDGREIVGHVQGRLQHLRRWDATSGEVLGDLGFPGGVGWILPGGRLAVAAAPNGAVLLDTMTGKEQGSIPGAAIHAVGISADAGRLLLNGKPGELIVRDLKTGKDEKLPTGWPTLASGLALSPDGTRLAAIGWTAPLDKGGEQVLVVRETGGGKEVARSSLGSSRANSYPSLQIVFSPDGKRLALASAGTVEMRDAATAAVLNEGAPGALMAPVVMAFAPDNQTVATYAGGERVVRRWEIQTGKLLGTFPGSALGLAFSPDGKQLATATSEHPMYPVRLHDVASGKETRTFEGHRNFAEFLKFSEDGRSLVSWGQGGQILTWEVATGKKLRETPSKPGRVVALLPDGKTVLYWLNDRTLAGFDLEESKDLPGLTPPGPSAMFPRVSADGRLLASYEADRLAGYVWDLARKTWVVRCLPARVTGSVALSPEGRRMVTADPMGDLVRVWEIPSGREMGRLNAGQGGTTALCFTPDGKYLLTSGRNTTTLVWDVARIPAPTGPVPPIDRKAEEIAKLWEQLTDARPRQASEALWQLVEAGDGAVAFLRGKLRPAPPAADRVKVARWLADLDSDTFEVRDRAVKELEDLGEGAETQLRKAATESPSAEVRKRVEELLERLDGQKTERLRQERGVEVLEYAATSQARKLLVELAGGRAEAALTAVAREALARLDARVERRDP